MKAHALDASEARRAAIPRALPAPAYPDAPISRRIVGLRVDACDYQTAIDRISFWAHRFESRVVAVANVHMTMEAKDDPSFSVLLNEADLTTADGMPLVWGLRMLGIAGATRVYGPDLTELVCARAAAEGIPVAFLGGAPATLERLVTAVTTLHAGLQVAYAASPPFRDLSEVENARIVSDIRSCGARILFVGLGCPKQERWMLAHRDRLPLVQIGVGAAFDFLAGTKRQAPRVMQRAGMEWAFRLVTEPRRLWRRYLKHNPRFVVAFARQLLAGSTRGEGSR